MGRWEELPCFENAIYKKCFILFYFKTIYFNHSCENTKNYHNVLKIIKYADH